MGKSEKVDKEENNKKKPDVVIVLKVYIHCDGCADQILKCLKGFDGVEDVEIYSKDNKVVVKGNKVDPLKIVDRIEKKCNKHVELISPKPKANAKDGKEAKQEEKDDEPLVIIVVLKVYMHCENCALEIKKSIERMKGVQRAEPDLKSSQVTVTGTFDPPKLVDFLYKRVGKHAKIVKEEFKDKEKARARKDKKKECDRKIEEKEKEKDFFFHYPPQYSLGHAYPPQIFSDENPNSCSIM
ncbi:hypothetical protein L1049_003683 [Liquidambar formosana]|uniref:HMA domain-containing protein n=1 Tax=Liquidambar formosana TaxID=63359 RepID=A0AAP0WV10_LIQFO